MVSGVPAPTLARQPGRDAEPAQPDHPAGRVHEDMGPALMSYG